MKRGSRERERDPMPRKEDVRICVQYAEVSGRYRERGGKNVKKICKKKCKETRQERKKVRNRQNLWREEEQDWRRKWKNRWRET